MSEKYIVPITYSVDKEYQDARFIKLQMDVCHDGDNVNGSNIPFEAIDKAKVTISNIAILAYVKQGKDGKPDFDKHNIEQNIDDDGKVQIVYLEQPVGFVPETNDYEYIEKDGHKYVRITGYVWRKYTNVVEEILERRKELSISMEITATKTETKDKKVFINEFYYTGITLLGADVRPGMKNAKAVVGQFALSFEERKKEVEKMKKIFDEKNENLIQFELSLESKSSKLHMALWKKYRDSNYYAYPVETYDSHVVYTVIDYSKDERKFFDCNYTVDNNEVKLDEKSVEVFSRFLTKEQLDKLEADQKTFTEMSTEVVGLRKFKSDIEEAQLKVQKQALIKQFSAVLDENTIKDFGEKMSNYSLDELKAKLSIAYAEKSLVKFTAKENETLSTAIVTTTKTGKKICI